MDSRNCGNTLKKVNMKKIILILIIGTCISSGCAKLDLNPLTEGSVEEWFTTDAEFEQAINALYDPDLWYIEMRRIYNMDRQSDDWNERTVVYEIPAGTMSSDDVQVKEAWSNLYKGIARANKILVQIDKMGSTGTISNDKLKLYKGQASFFRACFYSYLIFLWGDVPYIDGDITIDEAFSMGRVSKIDILNHIYQDFDIAVDNLPLVSSKGPLTKGAAYAFKARTATWMLDYQTARTAAKNCIDLGSYSLDDDYSRMFLLSTNSSPEFIFVIPRSLSFTGKGISIKNWLPRNTGGFATAEPSWELFCSYYCTDGLPIDKSPLYSPQFPFRNRDPRLAETIVEFETPFLGFIYDPSAVQVLNTKTNELVTNKDTQLFIQYASFNGLALKKGVDEGWTATYIIDPNMIIMRYADVLLMYAEACIELNQIDASATNALNQIRARAYKTNVSSIGSYPAITETDQAKLRTILRNERRVELAWENRRYFDLIRWKIADEALSRPICGLPTKNGLQANLNSGDYFFPRNVLPIIQDNGTVDLSPLISTGKIRVVVPRQFANRQYLWPLPSQDLKININLTQNPGY